VRHQISLLVPLARQQHRSGMPVAVTCDCDLSVPIFAVDNAREQVWRTGATLARIRLERGSPSLYLPLHDRLKFAVLLVTREWLFSERYTRLVRSVESGWRSARMAQDIPKMPDDATR
jgi:hypothetical protein